MRPRPEADLEKADLHQRRAREFQDLAQVILVAAPITGDYTNTLVDAAGALMYEAAKQWVNAVANLRGSDPQTNQEKLSELRGIIADHPVAFSLLDGATAAWHLHINADQARLTRREFDFYFAAAAAFADELHLIYRAVRQDR